MNKLIRLSVIDNNYYTEHERNKTYKEIRSESRKPAVLDESYVTLSSALGVHISPFKDMAIGTWLEQYHSFGIDKIGMPFYSDSKADQLFIDNPIKVINQYELLTIIENMRKEIISTFSAIGKSPCENAKMMVNDKLNYWSSNTSSLNLSPELNFEYLFWELVSVYKNTDWKKKLLVVYVM